MKASGVIFKAFKDRFLEFSCNIPCPGMKRKQTEQVLRKCVKMQCSYDSIFDQTSNVNNSPHAPSQEAQFVCTKCVLHMKFGQNRLKLHKVINV